MAQGCVMGYGAGVRHELWRTPPIFNKQNQILIFSPSNDLTTVKKSTVRVRLRTGGKRRLRGWLPPAGWTGCGVFDWHRTRGPLWAERAILGR